MKLVQDEKVNRAMMVPTMLKRLMDQPTFKDYDLSSLQVITYGAAPMPLEVIKKAIAGVPGHPVHQCLRPDGDGIDHYHASSGRPQHQRGRP